MLLSVNVLSCIISVNRAETKALVQALVELIYGLGLWVVSVQMLDLTTSGGRLLPPKPEVSSTVNRTQLDQDTIGCFAVYGGADIMLTDS